MTSKITIINTEYETIRFFPKNLQIGKNKIQTSTSIRTRKKDEDDPTQLKARMLIENTTLNKKIAEVVCVIQFKIEGKSPFERKKIFEKYCHEMAYTQIYNMLSPLTSTKILVPYRQTKSKRNS